MLPHYNNGMRRTAVFSAALLLALGVTLVSREPQTDPRLRKASRAGERNGWIQVHLEGKPAEIGFQHGCPSRRRNPGHVQGRHARDVTHEKKDWEFFRKAAEQVLWPHVEPEYREELNGHRRRRPEYKGVKLDIWDLVALNAWLELPYYDKWYDKSTGAPSNGAGPGDHCSAFVATGSYTQATARGHRPQ